MVYIYRKVKNKYYNCVFIKMFYVGFIVYAFIDLFQYTQLVNFTSSIKSVLRLISMFFLLPKIVFQDYDNKLARLSLLLVSLTVVSILLGGDKSLLLVPIILLGIKDIKIKKIIYLLFAITLLCITSHCVVFIIKYVIENNNFINMFHISGVTEKNKIMLYDNNMWAIRFTYCMMQYMYLTDRNKNRFIKTFVMIVLSIFMLLISQSRASFIICLLLIMYMVFENVNFFKKNIVIIRNAMIIFGFVSSMIFIMMPMFTNDLFSKVIAYLSGRPIIYNKAYNYIGLNIFPSINRFNDISKVFGAYMMPDNSYISVFLKWGLLLSVIMFVLTYFFINKNKNEEIVDYYIAVLAIWFIVEFISMDFVVYFIPLIIIHNYLSKEQ